jgi:uncharacterized protein (DUF1330 family)
MERAREWYCCSAEYAETLAVRQRALRWNLIFVDSVTA